MHRPRDFSYETYHSPFNSNAFYNPFIDYTYLPHSFDLENLEVDELLDRTFELGHTHLALESNRFALKLLTSKIYQGIEGLISNPDAQSLIVPSLENSPGLKVLDYEKRLILDSFEAVEEIVTIARSVGLSKRSDDPFSLKLKGVKNFEKFDSKEVEKVGISYLKKNFGKRYVSIYKEFMDLTDGGDPILVYKFAQMALKDLNVPLLIVDNPILEKYKTDVLLQLMSNNFTKPKDWYSRKLLEPEGLIVMSYYYLESPYTPINRFKNIIKSFQKEKQGKCWTIPSLMKSYIKFGQPEVVADKAHRLGIILVVGDDMLEGQKIFSEEERTVDHYASQAVELQHLLQAFLIVDHRNFFKVLTELFDFNWLEQIMLPLKEKNEDSTLLKMLSESPPEKFEVDNLTALTLGNNDYPLVPVHLKEKYKPLYIWEDIREKLFSGSKISQLLFNPEGPVWEDLLTLLKQNVKYN